MSNEQQLREALLKRLREAPHLLRTRSMPLSDFIPLIQQAADALSQPMPEAAAQPTITVQQAWEWAGGNPGYKPTTEELKAALQQLDELCDEMPEAAAQGWKLVPVECTHDMAKAAWGDVINWADFAAQWKRAVIASPAAPEVAYSHADVAQAHTDGYRLGLAQLDRPAAPEAAKPEQQAQADGEVVSVTDEMAYAFHRALTDSALSADEVEEIKTGLRAALANYTRPQPAAQVAQPLTDETVLDFLKELHDEQAGRPTMHNYFLVARNRWREKRAAHGIGKDQA